MFCYQWLRTNNRKTNWFCFTINDWKLTWAKIPPTSWELMFDIPRLEWNVQNQQVIKPLCGQQLTEDMKKLITVWVNPSWPFCEQYDNQFQCPLFFHENEIGSDMGSRMTITIKQSRSVKRDFKILKQIQQPLKIHMLW